MEPERVGLPTNLPMPVQAANSIGVPVFNAPFSNTRSVAEMVICEVIALARQLGDRSSEVHRWGRRRTSSRTFAERPRLVDIQLFFRNADLLHPLPEAEGTFRKPMWP